MKLITLATALCLTIASSSYACVTVNPSTGTYTIDKSGCVGGGGKTTKQAPTKHKDSKKK